VVYAVIDSVLHQNPFPSLADAFYVGGYPVLAAGLLVLIRGRISGRDRAGLIDAAIIATGLGLLSWTFLIKPIAADPSLSLAERLVSLAYPWRTRCCPCWCLEAVVSGGQPLNWSEYS
jgi:diguanylate cyclase